jgi:hypothetical protein
MNDITHLDGWIVVVLDKPITPLQRTRQLARQEAKRLRPTVVGRCVVCRARQITVWKPAKKAKA